MGFGTLYFIKRDTILSARRLVFASTHHVRHIKQAYIQVVANDSRVSGQIDLPTPVQQQARPAVLFVQVTRVALLAALDPKFNIVLVTHAQIVKQVLQN